MTRKKTHPYDYITSDNFDSIKSTIETGLLTKKTPREIAILLQTHIGLPHDVAMALVNFEFNPVFKELDKNE